MLKLWPHLTRAEAEKRLERTHEKLEPFDYRFAAESQPIDKLTARYGVTWEDISSREDRDHWIAGSSLKVIDLQTNEVIAERIGYLMDPGQGSEAGFRSPWGMALYAACPSFSKTKGGHPYLSYRTRNFVLQTLQPAED